MYIAVIGSVAAGWQYSKASPAFVTDLLGPQMVPSSCWGSNVRAILTRAQWEAVRQNVFKEKGKVCFYCSRKPKRLDCHEIWEYREQPDANLQSLVDIIPLCQSCHAVCHLGLAAKLGNYDVAVSWMCRVRKIDKTAALTEIDSAWLDFDHRSKLEWSLEINELQRFL